MKTIEIAQVDVNDRTYCISYPLEDDLLASSIARYGVLVPVGLLDRQPPVLVTGFKRMEAARKLGIARVPCVFLDIDERRALLTAINDNLKRRLNTIEKAWCVEKMLFFGFPEEDIYETAKLVGLPARERTLKTVRAMHSMEEGARAFIVKHNLPLAVVEQLLWFDVDEISHIVRLTDPLNVTTSIFREAVQLLALLKVKMGRIDFCQFEGTNDMEALRQALKKATHPLLSRLEEKFERIRKACALPPYMSIKVDPVFEKEWIDICVRARTNDEVDRALEKLEALSGRGLLRGILELTHGTPDRK